MSLLRRELVMLGFSMVMWFGCSSDSHQGVTNSGGHSGQPAAGAGNPTGTSGSGASTAEGGTGELGGSGGMLGTGAVAGSAVSSGGTSGGSDGGSAGAVLPPPTWTCTYSAYADGQCDCGCGAVDKDCSTGALDECARCNSAGSCGGSACPGRIDPNDVTSCLTAPAGWKCDPSLYDDGKTCDCGCGIQDPDCPNTDAASCDNCSSGGSCAHGACPSSLVPDDNTRCQIPDGWTCTPATYGDGTCNCGCGVVDVDCPDDKASSCEVCDTSSCWPLHCDKIAADDNAHCSAPPPSWNCSARLYHDGTRCDCGCGALDPDCSSTDVDACDKCDSPGSCAAHACPSTITPDNNALCTQPSPPDGWTCPPNAYGDGLECDCGCGVPDIDCRDGNFSTCLRCLVCGGHGDCTTTVDQTDTTQCAPPPAAWICSADAWYDSICDCGCGVLDSYCQNIPLLYVCGNYPVEGCSAGNRTHIDPDHNYLCTINVPSDWTCDRAFYYDGFCDCGCGAVDLDCTTNLATDCDQCADEGSCSTTACPGTIVADDTAHCSAQ